MLTALQLAEHAKGAMFPWLSVYSCLPCTACRVYGEIRLYLHPAPVYVCGTMLRQAERVANDRLPRDNRRPAIFGCYG